MYSRLQFRANRLANNHLVYRSGVQRVRRELGSEIVTKRAIDGWVAGHGMPCPYTRHIVDMQ